MTSDRHSDCLALAPAGARPTCVYLKDGTKVVLRRDGRGCWLEVVPQSVVAPVRRRPGTSWDNPAGPPLISDLSVAKFIPPTKEAMEKAAKDLEKKVHPYRTKPRRY